MNYTEKIIKQSNYWYNDGLKRANIRDLSGSIISLRRSLQYCRQNVQARNLLGLVYYGRGEVNEALVEWVISKSLRPRDNVANYFIKQVQNSQRELNAVNQNIKKYNQCLIYCKQDAADLAFIQLKKVVAEAPNFVKAYQLMALLCIQKEQYSRAKQVLKKAHKIDITDVITLYYMNELTEITASGKKSKEDKESSRVYQVGNETIIQPTTEHYKEHTSIMTGINVAVGLFIGIVVMAFLVQPAFLKEENLENANAVREYSKEIDAQIAQINALKTELDGYRNTSDAAETAIATGQDIQGSYEALYIVEEQLEEQATSNADMAQKLLEVNPKALGVEGVEIYTHLQEEIFVPVCENIYETANTAIEQGRYEDTITALLQIIEMEPSYDSYQAMLKLANAYEEQLDQETAMQYYNRIRQEAPDTEAAITAATALDAMTVGSEE